jgi:two-component system nitrogen regulation sensor histidine kinase NtrY
MFRRYPYWGWLVISLLLWCINGYYFHLQRSNMLPERMAVAVSNDLQRGEKIFDDFVSDNDLVRRLFNDSLTEQEVKRAGNLPFFIFGYKGDSLEYWNTNSVIAGRSDTTVNTWKVARNEKGIFVERCLKPFPSDTSRSLVVLFPVVISYPLENDYLKSHFAASANIPVKTKIIKGAVASPETFPVKMRDGQTVFSLRFNENEIQKWEPDIRFIGLLIAALLTSILWVHLMIIHLTRKSSTITGFILTLLVVAILRWLLYAYGLPFNLHTLKFFDPRLYASSKFLPSFGDLCINALCFLWIVVFLTRHTPYKDYFKKLRSPWVRVPIAVGLSITLLAYVFFFVDVIRSLVIDSSISFDVTHFYGIDIYTIYGLLIIGAIMGISCLVIYLFNVQFSVLLANKWVKYALLAATGILYLFLIGKTHETFPWCLVGWLLLFCIVLDIPNFKLVSDLLEPHMIVWALFICLFSTLTLQYFNQAKEQKARIAFVELKLSPREAMTEYAFSKAAGKIEHDEELKEFFVNPSLVGRKIINQRFDTLYFKNAPNKYQPTLYLFDAAGNSLYNKDTVGLDEWIEEKEDSEPTASPHLFYKESILNNHYYLVYMPVYSDSINQKIGYVVVDLDQKKQVKETVYPELLQATNKYSGDREYAYAVYINGKLINQVNDYPFPTRLKNDELNELQTVFYNDLYTSELHYKNSDKRVMVVAYRHNKIVEWITLFSYIFLVQLILALVILVYQLYLSYFTGTFTTGSYTHLTLRKRVHFSMLAVVFVSFVIIGIITVAFFIDQYRNSNKEKLQGAMQIAKQNVQDYLQEQGAYDADYIFDSVGTSKNFELFIANLANSQKVDINVFSNNGELLATSQDEIYDKGLIAGLMRPDAYYKLNNSGQSNVLQNERVGKLTYLSSYEPMRDEQGATLGYINVPFFSSENDLKFQVSNIVVTLINLYAFIFLLSGLITVAITRWLTRSFNIVIQQFGRLNLQRNERISWPHDDEIGLLVSEYNKMVNKVEENAALLAERERESAWREMARQVAHEIKNPLTPMKLNIQYLQQAMKNDSPNIKELTARVSVSIIEQIDNLSYIASEFSNFAKMPEARPEDLELSELMDKAVALFANDPDGKVVVQRSTDPLYVYSDRSQLLRVFNNVLENARHAISERADGRIYISVKREDDHAVIAIADNGAGISEEVAKRIFQPYFTTKSSGTGLGLAMTKKIVEFWKGDIWFESKEGEGTTFYIRLPLHIHGPQS